jgi:hypothetical protein
VISCPERKLSTTFRCSKSCDVHFITCIQWKDTSFFNMITHTLTVHTWHWEHLKSLSVKCSTIHPTVQTLDCHVFWTLRDHMRGQHFEYNEAFQQTMCSWLQNTETDFYHNRIFKLLWCRQKYLNHSGSSMKYWRDISSTSRQYLFLHMYPGFNILIWCLKVRILESEKHHRGIHFYATVC